MPIEKVKARQIFDSRGEPTLEVDLITDIGLFRSSVPCTPSNSNDALDLRGNNAIIFNGPSVLNAVKNINKIIAPELIKSRFEVCQQREIDLLMIKLDGSKNKSKLGANAILGVSMACCKAGAIKGGIPLYRYISRLADTQPIIPVPMFNIINGGKLAGNPLICQEFMIMPTGAESFKEAMKMGVEVFKILEKMIAESEELKLPLTVGDEGGFSPQIEEDTEALSMIVEAIKAAGYEGKVKIAIDMSASSFCKDGQYDLQFKTEDTDPDDYIEAEALKNRYLEILTDFPQLVSIKDPFDQDDWDSWPMLSDQPIQIVADDLTAMNLERIEEATERGAGNCLTIRLPQVGTVTEAIDCFKMARSSGWSAIVSAGYGETEDCFVADFVVGLSAGQFKAGAICRGERISKYNQILRIEEELGQGAKYAGEMFKNPLSLISHSENHQKDETKKKKRKKTY
ncbi:enolase [Microplitis demolitor]|uniref:enolase n=1 Tax=Microplitis demolitor TaxID=69319 RepID=UPI0004CDB8BF|nr:enolase [Microplitis demolitor]